MKNIKILLWFVDGMEKRKYLTISSNIFGIMCKVIKIILFLENKDRGVEGWFEKICQDSNDYERLHEICEREIQKHKREKLLYRNII